MMTVNGFLLKANHSNDMMGDVVSTFPVTVPTEVKEIHPEKTCRVCLTTYESNNWFQFFSSNVVGPDVSMASVLSDCFKIEFHRDENLPDRVCTNCTSAILALHAFRECVINCQGLLNKHRVVINKEEKTKWASPRKVQISTDVLQNVVEENNPTQKVEPNESCDILSNSIHDHDYTKKNEDLKNPRKRKQRRSKNVSIKLKKPAKVQWWSQTRAPPYICKICGFNFDIQYRKFYMHVRRHYMVKIPCEYCGKRFTRHELKIHVRSHTTETPFICAKCPAQFNVLGNLQRHMISHTGEKLYVCEICGKAYTQSCTLKHHQQLHHNGDKVISENSVKEKSHFCEYCNRGFKSELGLRLHSRLHSESDTSCKICCKKFSSAFNLRVHTLWHEVKVKESNTNNLQKWICDLCSMECSGSKSLIVHILTHMNNRKMYACTTHCDKTFTTKASLDAHLQIQRGDSRFFCDICLKRCTSSTILRKHYRIHTGEKPYKCEICSKSFVQQPHLTSHMVTHTGEKKHACQFCEKRFTTSTNLIVHKRRHTGETPFICDSCQKRFYDSSSLKKHIKTNHPTV